ncbi:chalcone isomerase family protein [Acidovorax sp. SUPP2522]|uniref:chalcone isomerase family protein n=1 Tax=unclassified Acidovorax TaxID=2684926 RepID=UPI00234BEEC7|nr:MULTISPECIES: chalcone isomerase family protein [unclassified Acidovorax]WCM97334.1 chalcone isomerase family protein [Acidovorax sp. GBBC 1281]GKT18805.1 chalcone isomerase family protein [Acidovorax sp. SUPP2522]
MMFLQRWLVAALAGLLVTMGAASAQVVTVADVKYCTALQLQGSPLLLNGAGIRYKAVFKVYTAGLYLERKAGTPQEVAALRGPKRLSITMLRDIESAELGKLFSRGMEDNMDKASFSRLVPGVLRMSEIFSQHKKLSAGDTFTVDWLPGTGTVISVKGVAQGEPFREPEFFDALMGIWLGERPADWKLKDALLGKAGG